jgi:hypothetical protein
VQEGGATTKRNALSLNPNWKFTHALLAAKWHENISPTTSIFTFFLHVFLPNWKRDYFVSMSKSILCLSSLFLALWTIQQKIPSFKNTYIRHTG